uniref:Uncharacterized protein n=1 Tax=viral metagenome TaxID=1070528 RepID=A0A6C0E304_9ZZZZ
MTDTSNNYTSDDISAMQERNEQTLNDIKTLQKVELEMYDTLEKNATSNTMTPEEKDQLVKKINEISQMRINLYATLKDIYSFFQNNVAGSRVTLAEQKMAVDIVENELNESKRRLQALEEDKYNKLRLVEINTYYGKQYDAHTSIMKTIVIICIPVLFFGILAKIGILPGSIAAILTAIVIMIGIIVIGKKMIDLMNRDNMNFDEYDWNFNTKDAPADNVSSPAKDPWDIPTRVCIGAECCNEYSSYDVKQNMCVPNISPSETSGTNTSSNTSTPSNNETTSTSMNDLMNELTNFDSFSNYAPY